MKIIKKIVKLLFKVFYIFPFKNNHIFILSFDGKSFYGFDGKALVDYSNDNNLNYKFIWGINKNEKIPINKNIKYVYTKSLKGIYYIMTCRTLVTNINPPSYIPFRKKQIIINTWHGYPMKNVGRFNEDYDLEQVNVANCFTSQSDEYTKYLIKDAFLYKGDILNCGSPRNDVLFNKEKIKKIRKEIDNKYDIKNKKIILYAPTFRGNFDNPNIELDYKKLLNSLNKEDDEWVIFNRLHPMINNKNSVKMNNVIDMSNYPDMQELLCVSDILITDYSSTSFDYSLMEKPVFIYAYDYDEYIKSRDISPLWYNRPFPISNNNDELINQITNFDIEEYKKKLKEYFSRIKVYESGNACSKVYEYINRKKEL